MKVGFITLHWVWLCAPSELVTECILAVCRTTKTTLNLFAISYISNCMMGVILFI